MKDEQPISFVGKTNSGSQTEQTYEFDRDGTITGVLVGTEVGQEYTLQNYAKLIRSGSVTNLWESLDKAFLAGNGRDYDLQLRYEFSRGDKLVLRSENTNTDGHEYHHSIVVRIDYETGLERVTNALRRAI
jgi:hypothetical protein